MSDSDVFDDVRSAAPAQQEDSGDAFADVRGTAPPQTQALQPQAPSNWTNAAKGVGQAGLAIGSAALHGINSAANDIVPGTQGRQQLQAQIDADPILNYKGGPEAQPILNALRQITAPVSALGKAVHQGISDFTSPRTADVVSDLAALAPGARGATGAIGDTAAIEEGHPLTAMAQAEAARLSGFQQRAQQLGFDLPEGGTRERHADAAATNTPLVNAVVRSDMKLPRGTPLSPDSLSAGRDAYVSPAYSAIENLKTPIVLPTDMQQQFAALQKKTRGQFAPGLDLPTGPTISGKDAVAFSQDARWEARASDAAARAGNPQAARDAVLHRQAAQTVEDAVSDNLNATGQGRLADNWDAARIYAAKSHSYEDALDGAGNVNVANLKSQLFKKGKPLGGDQEMLANIGAQYPEAFKTSRVTQPKPSVVRRGAAMVAPAIGGAVGGWMGGPLGAASGTAVGQYTGEKILNR